MNLMNRFITLILLCLFAVTAACAGDAESKQRRPFLEYWLAIYSGVQQVGCMQTTLSCDTLSGEEVFKRQDSIYLRTKDSNSTGRADVSDVVYATEHFTPIIHTLVMDASSTESGKTEEHHSEMELDYIKKTQKTIYRSGNETKEETVKADLDSKEDCSPEFSGRPLKTGDKLTCSTYKFPSVVAGTSGHFAFTRSSSDIQVLRREKIEVDNKTCDALVLQDKSKFGEATRWQLDNGVIVKEDMPYSGVALKAVTEKEAREWLDRGGLDLATFLDRIESDKKIAYINSVTELDVRLMGVWDKVLVSNDNRQKVKYDPRAKTAEYSITASLFDPNRSTSLPISDPGMQKWRQQSDGLEVNNETIKKLAHEIVGDEKNAYLAAGKIRKWVNENIKYVDGAKTPNSALAILQEKQGVCAHLAILYTTLARAAGIPTYLVVGPVYFTDDLQWHAWAESYVGEWVPFDPTRDTDFVDASHIKMFIGNAEVMSNYGVARGQLRAEVLRFKYWTPIGDGTKLYWVNDKNEWWQSPIDAVYMFLPSGMMIYGSTNISALILSGFGATEGIRATVPDGETIVLPQESKVLPCGSTYRTSTGYTLQSPGCTIIHTPNGTTVVLPPNSKLLPPE